MSIQRRNFIKSLAAAASASLLTIPTTARAAGKGKVVVIGGGFGGSTAAKYVKMMDPAIDVTLIEPNKTYTSCPLSNEVLVRPPRHSQSASAMPVPQSAASMSCTIMSPVLIR